ncbi:hypothetical protein DICPUDRAFT_53337 [Dictyostelium purpureum]|uniref:glutathione gamma-glutamylcysteinyltransferase n=1 Tax=Dictyostelium purpureum TaxID=5786 RepID=F0ZCA6_DICPU|nr:uncharacterized protein DICPUDRAFT_53337 [Dictyostelium purpureum]EGC38412.1 hypothetical protein DICPUDRAFT_53337 [Dictyostelium purpureum]|eukprot:XP_003285073.1 hypothetical protein DICPUDRAFT_53337 [Dictyostelium purpureum]
MENNIVSNNSNTSNTSNDTNNKSKCCKKNETPTITEKINVVSFYKRDLPSHLIEFSSEEGKLIFKEALLNGNMENYFSLAEQFLSQSDPAFCGLATLAMVLNALKIDPNRLWKGPWRWFAEDMLDCCIPIDSVKKRGITFTEFSCLSKCNGANIKSYRGDENDIHQFRSSIIEASSKQGIHLVMSYSRKTLGQTGSGHYSPIGGYHKEKDLALVLDVARFKYAPHWVPVETLWESMKVLDKETNKPRGYYVLSKNHLYEPSFCRIKNTLSWSSVADKFLNSFPSLLESHQPSDFKDVIEILFKHLPTETPYVLCAYSHELHKNLMKGDKDHDLIYNSQNNNNNNDQNIIDSNTKNNNNNVNSENRYINKWDLFFEEITNNSKSYQVLKEMIDSGRIDWRVTHQHNHHGSNKEICHDYPIQLATFLFLAFPAHIFNGLSIDIRANLAEIRNLDGLNINVITKIMNVREEMFLVNQNPCECTVNGVSAVTCKGQQQLPPKPLN